MPAPDENESLLNAGVHAFSYHPNRMLTNVVEQLDRMRVDLALISDLLIDVRNELSGLDCRHDSERHEHLRRADEEAQEVVAEEDR